MCLQGNGAPQVVQAIWNVFRRVEVDLFASEDSSHYPFNIFSKDWDALAHDWPSTRLYALPPIALLRQVIRQIKEVGPPCGLTLAGPDVVPWVNIPELITLLALPNSEDKQGP